MKSLCGVSGENRRYPKEKNNESNDRANDLLLWWTACHKRQQKAILLHSLLNTCARDPRPFREIKYNDNEFITWNHNRKITHNNFCWRIFFNFIYFSHSWFFTINQYDYFVFVSQLIIIFLIFIFSFILFFTSQNRSRLLSPSSFSSSPLIHYYRYKLQQHNNIYNNYICIQLVRFS